MAYRRTSALDRAQRAPSDVGAAGYTRFPPRTATDVTPDADRAAATPRPRQQQTPAPSAELTGGRLPPLAAIFMVAVLMPVLFNVGSLALTPSRVVMVFMFIPALMMYAAGRAGRVLPQDIFVFLFAFWTGVTFFIYGGFARIELIGISIIEIVTPFLLARCLIRDARTYMAFLKLAFVIAVVLMILAAIESTTGRRPLSMLFGAVGRVYPALPINYEARLGFLRSMTVFQHPILFGVSVGLLFAPLWMMPRANGGVAGPWRAWPVAVAVFFSLSVGAWLGVVVQALLMAWNRVLQAVKARWIILIGLSLLAYVVVDILSNRTPFEVFISYLTLNSHTAYWRKLIFIYGMDNVWANPLFGIGLADWQRPSWMHSPSVDNFWLLNAMRHGIPGFLLSVGVFLSVILTLARARIEDEAVRAMRLGAVIALVGVSFSLATVHIWGTALYFVWFVLGASSWIVANAPPGGQSGPGQGSRRPRPR